MLVPGLRPTLWTGNDCHQHQPGEILEAKLSGLAV
jgi:hypothetical protein